MSEINVDLYQLQLDTINVQSQQQANDAVVVKSDAQKQNVSEKNYATKADISKQALADINNIISKEDVFVSNLNKSNEIYEALSEVRAQLAEFIKDFRNTDKYDNIEILKELDKKTNDIIVDIEKLIRKEEKNGLVDFNYTNIFLDGLKSISKLNISDKNYVANIENIMNLVISRENSYKNLINNNLSKIAEVDEEFNSLDKTPTKVNENNINNLQQEIISNTNSYETLIAVSSDLSSEVVLRLLNL